MTDPNLVVRKWLASGLPSTRVWVAVLPAYDEKNGTGFRPEDGPGIVVSLAGGEFHCEAPIFQGVFQITVYAGQDKGAAAGALSAQIRTLIHGKNGIDLSPEGFVMACNETAAGMPSAEPDAGLATSTSMYEMILR